MSRWRGSFSARPRLLKISSAAVAVDEPVHEIEQARARLPGTPHFSANLIEIAERNYEGRGGRWQHRDLETFLGEPIVNGLQGFAILADQDTSCIPQAFL